MVWFKIKSEKNNDFLFMNNSICMNQIEYYNYKLNCGGRAIKKIITDAVLSENYNHQTHCVELANCFVEHIEINWKQVRTEIYIYNWTILYYNILQKMRPKKKKMPK